MRDRYPTKATMVRDILEARGELDALREKVRAMYPQKHYRAYLEGRLEHHPLARLTKAKLAEIYDREVPDIDIDDIVFEFYD